MSDVDSSTQTPAASPPALTEAYQKAHKEYGLFSALLFAWELVGFKIQKATVASYEIEILSPQAIPWVFIVLVVYFAYRVTIEWLQCDSYRRRTKPSTIDFVGSHIIGASSIALFTYQRIAQAQLASTVTQTGGESFFALLVGSTTAMVMRLSLPYLWETFRSWYTHIPVQKGDVIAPAAILFIGLLAVVATALSKRIDWGLFLWTLFVWLIFFFVGNLFQKWLRHRRRISSE
jgi:hypothetical protein